MQRTIREKCQAPSSESSWAYGKSACGLKKEPVPKIVKVSEIQEVISLGDGSTKIRVQFHKDVIVPTTAGESERVIRALNPLLGERYAVEERDAKANVDFWRKEG